tara:strand:+ start:539 stop:2986 length:2448 start_codon:yes stop_codon:yes gene_type:complete
MRKSKNKKLIQANYLIIILPIIWACSGSGSKMTPPHVIQEVVSQEETDKRYKFNEFSNVMISPWGEVEFNYSLSRYSPSKDFPSNEKYKIEDYGFLQVITKGTHPGDDANKDEISPPGPWTSNGQWFEANLNDDDFTDLIYVGNTVGTREFVPEDLMITFINDGKGHFKIAPELFASQTFPCVNGGANWLSTENNDPKKECGNQADYTNGKIVADFNGDGLSDYYDTSILYLTNEDGQLINSSQTNLPSMFFEKAHGHIFVHDATYGDLDGDGDLDIFVPISDYTEHGFKFGGEPDECSGCNEQIPYTALINDGNGNFTANHNIPLYDYWVEYDQKYGSPLSQLWPTTTTIGDFDNDGFGDIAMGWFNPEISHLYGFSEHSSGVIYLNDGQNDWTIRKYIELPANYFGSNGNANDMEAFDFNNDGYLDIVMASTIHEPYYESRVVQFFQNNLGTSFSDVTETVNPSFSKYANGNPYSNYWIGQGKLHILDYDHDGDLDIIDSTTRTYALINNNGTFEWYENFVDVDEDRILWPIEIDNDFHYDFIGSNVNCGPDSCITNFFQVLDPLNQDLLNQFLAKTDKYEDAANQSLINLNQVRRSTRDGRLIYRRNLNGALVGYKSEKINGLNLYAGNNMGSLKGNFIGFSMHHSPLRYGLIFADTNVDQSNHSEIFGISNALLEFKSSSIFIEIPLNYKFLDINYGVSLDNLIINSFTENMLFVKNVYKEVENNSLNLFVDLNYAFEFLGFIGELDIGISNNQSINLFGFEDRGFVYPANQSRNYFDGALKFFRGPFFLSIDKQNNNNPTINIGFNYRAK